MKRSKGTSPSFTGLISKVSSGWSGTSAQKWADGARNVSGIDFGRPSSLGKSLGSPSFGTTFQKLAGRVATGGVSNAFGSNSGPAYLGGFGLSSLVSGIAGLFGAGKKKQPAPLTLFQLPSSISQTFQVGHSSPTTQAQPANSNLHVHLQAFDSSSILDHSNEIAKAVKTAILNSHSLNDVIAEL
jgi:hypothetical protein